ncbi:MAG: EAL domain-containing protein [Burkholderiales bacterium]
MGLLSGLLSLLGARGGGAARGFSAEEERFRRLTALSADWFWESDAEHRMTWLTGGAAVAQLLGSASAYGRRLWEVPVIEIEPQALAAHLARLERLEPFHELEVVSYGPGGTRSVHVVSGEPRFDADDRFIGYRGVGKDVTAKRTAEEALALAKERLELAIEGGSSAIWDLDLESRRTHLGEGWYQLLGDAQGVRSGVSFDSLEHAHPQDRERMRRAFLDAITGAAPVFNAEGRFRTEQGEWKWLHAVGRVTRRGPDGRALRMTGMVLDIDARKRAEQASRDAEERYRALVDLSPDGVVVSWNGYVEYANAAAERIWSQLRSGAPVGQRTEDLIHPGDAARHRERLEFLLAGPGATPFAEFRLLRADGSAMTVEMASVSYLERGRLLLQTVVRDVSEAREAREKLAEREQRFRDVVEASGEFVWETDAAWRYTYLSARIESVLGYTQSEMLGRSPQEFMPLGEARSVDAWFEQRVPGGGPFRELVHRSITKSGRVIWQQVNGIPVFDAAGKLKGYRGTGADITARRLAEERIQYLATRDAQTGLPNRLLLAERAEQAIVAAARARGQLALLTFDLDRFKLVNDSLGHAAGDALLRAVGERLANTLRRQDTLARLGGDEFALLWDGMRADTEADAVAQRILNALARPFMVDGRSLAISASIGIAVYPGDGATFGELLRNADLAMSRAKAAGRNGVRRYTAEMGRSGSERLALENDLRRALSRGEFTLHYQPVLTGRATAPHARIVGAEVLVRWRHPERGLLMPDVFIPLAEEIGLIRAIGEWTADRALAQIGAWRIGPDGPWFALNVSPAELAEGAAYVARLEDSLRRNGVSARSVELEVTERALMGDVAENIEALRRIGALGVRLAIDDFGTGYSSLAYLRRLPIHKLKIDQSFVRELASNRDDAVIVETIASMARSLGLHVAAEGVEDDAQLERLLALGCEQWQGHRFSPPLDAPAFERLLRGGAVASVA